MTDITKKNLSGEKVKMITCVGLMTALMCVLGPLAFPLPFSPVPISLGTLAIYFAVYVTGMRMGALSCLVYLLLGFIGVPVFTSFTSGPGKLLGPTGGYLIGYIFLAFVCGALIEKWPGKIYHHFAGMVIGTGIFYLFGTLWLAYEAGMSFTAALAAGVLPFIPGDLAKIVIAILVGSQIKKRLQRAGML